MKITPCAKPMHKECRCCRPAGHEDACNCRYPWGPGGPPVVDARKPKPHDSGSTEEKP